MATRAEELAALDDEQEKMWRKFRREALADLDTTLANDDGFARLAAISDEEWDAAVQASAESAAEEVAGEPRPLSRARDWRPLVNGMSDVQKMIHLAMRYDDYDVERIRVELLRQRRIAYDQELTHQAARVGCAGRTGRLSNGSILSSLNDESAGDAQSIANTYNYDLAIAIQNIGVETPRANRNTYSKRLREWEQARAKVKNPQIQQHTELTARARAQQDFFAYNDAAIGHALLKPEQAMCPVCLGWIERGAVPLHVATDAPPPYHVNCPHYWKTFPDKVAKSECPNLWMGS